MRPGRTAGFRLVGRGAHTPPMQAAPTTAPLDRLTEILSRTMTDRQIQALLR